jgi:hypothetical protein
MRSSVSERSLIIESDDDDVDHPPSGSAAAARRRRLHHRHHQEGEGSGSDSDSGPGSGSDSSSPCATPRVPPTASSYTQQWPQSYRFLPLLCFAVSRNKNASLIYSTSYPSLPASSMYFSFYVHTKEKK